MKFQEFSVKTRIFMIGLLRHFIIQYTMQLLHLSQNLAYLQNPTLQHYAPSFIIIVKVVTKWTNVTKNQETLIYMEKPLVQTVMAFTIFSRIKAPDARRCRAFGNLSRKK